MPNWMLGRATNACLPATSTASFRVISSREGAMADHTELPGRFENVEALDEFLAQPRQALIDDLAAVPGDILILGVAGKMGPTLARLARNAAPERGIIGVA